MGRHLGIDFGSILVDIGSQVGVENRAKIDQKWHRKNDEKTKGNKMAKKSQQEGAQGPRRPTREHGAASAPALTRSRAPQGDNIKRTSITTDQRLQDLTRLGPEARRIFEFFTIDTNSVLRMSF